MKRIDFYVQHLARYQADAVVLVSDTPVAFRFSTGDKHSTQKIEHAQVMALVQEVAPQIALDSIRATGRGDFVYEEGASPVNVRVEAAAGALRVLIMPAAGIALDVSEPAPRSAMPSRPQQAQAAPAYSPPAQAAPAAAPAPAAAAVPSSGGGQVEGRLTIVQGIKWDLPPGVPKIEKFLRALISTGSSDLHVCSGEQPICRLHGEMQIIEDRPPFESDELKEMFWEIAPARNREQFEAEHDTDFAYEIPGIARFRVNLFRDRKGVGAVFRQIPFKIMTPEQLGIPKNVLDLCYLPKGLVVVTGPTGSGKSTTLATMIDYINRNRTDHIITIEDPVEFVHENKKCLINQREVGTHTEGFKRALRAALREDPDIVLVGEMRDLETIAIAIETAETGHLVFGTLHTTTAPSTVDRIIDQFSADRQAQIRTMLSESLRGVVAQMLCKKIGGGRVACYEILITNPAVSNLIREGKTYQLVSVMQTGKSQGMQTLNDHLIRLVKDKVIEAKEAFMKSTDKKGLKDLYVQNNIAIDGLPGG